MRALLDRFAGVRPHELDYTVLLQETNVFGRGRRLVPDPAARRRLATLLSEAEASLDLTAAITALTEGRLCSPDEMKVGCELEYRTFFEPNHFARVLYIGSGAYPQIAFYVLERDPASVFDAVDIVPHASVLCSRLAAKLGYADRLFPFTRDAIDLEPERIERYDAYFISSAVRPKNATIERLLRHKPRHARIYAREDPAHPDFYELVEVSHPDLMTARHARSLWRERTGMAYPLPTGCETYAAEKFERSSHA
jgi:hypothetical protein